MSQLPMDSGAVADQGAGSSNWDWAGGLLDTVVGGFNTWADIQTMKWQWDFAADHGMTINPDGSFTPNTGGAVSTYPNNVGGGNTVPNPAQASMFGGISPGVLMVGLVGLAFALALKD